MTLIRNIKGFYTHGETDVMKKEKVVVWFTSDNLGETFSMSARGHMITVNFSDIERIVERERSKGYTDGHFIINEGWGEKADESDHCPNCGARMDGGDEQGKSKRIDYGSYSEGCTKRRKKPCDDCQQFDCYGCEYVERKTE